MTQAEVKLTTAQLEKTVSFLGKIKSSATAEERKLISELLGKLSPQLAAHRAELATKAEGAKLAEFTAQMSRLVIDTFPFMKTHGLTPALLRYMESVKTVFDKAEKLVEDVSKDYNRIHKKKEFEHLDPPAPLVQKALIPARRRLEKITQAYLAAKQVPITPSQAYTLADKRAVFAKRCFETGLTEGKGASGWEEVNMIGMCFGDQLTHFRLGEAFLNGNPRGIRAAADMDTACRDGVDTAAWNFILEKLGDIQPITSTRAPGRR